MASPVTGQDFQRHTQLVGTCEKLTYLLGAMEKVAAFIDYQYDADGEPTQALLSLGLPPSGLVLAYWTTTTDWTTAKAEVERLGRTATDIAAGTAPFYRMCDGLNGTPDLRGRMILGCNNTTDNGLTVRSVNGTGGEESHKLEAEEIAPHVHTFPSDKKLPYLAAVSGAGGGFTGIDIAEANSVVQTAENVGGEDDETATPHENMPPFHCLYWVIRTSRTS